MITLTPKAVGKALEIMQNQEPPLSPADTMLRIGAIGGGCSGLQYKMYFEGKEEKKPSDEIYEFDDGTGPTGQKLQVAVNQASKPFLEGISVDYVDTIEKSGFTFDNPNAKSSCGCGESFQV